jgi:hypothetical protein
MKNEFAEFNKLIEGQFKYGGTKYKSTSSKEATDELFDAHTHKGLMFTIDKYTYRFKNLARERDLLKIAAYMYIVWLKRGFHLEKNGKAIPINTTVDVKSQFFTDFILTSYAYYCDNQFYLETQTTEDAIQKISNVVKSFSQNEWLEIPENKLSHIYCLSFIIWNNTYFSKGLAGKDTDTENEKHFLKELLLKAVKEVKYTHSPDFVDRLIEHQVEILSKKRV